MVKKLSKIFIILILGAIGGVASQFFLVPYLVEAPFFENWELIKKLERGAIINPVQQIFMQENQVLEESVQRVKDTVFEVSFGENSGCGFVLTSDGLIVISLSLLPQVSQDYVFINKERVKFSLLKQDTELKLALIKIEKRNLKTTPFFEFEKLKIGASVFLIEIQASGEKTIQLGIISNFNDDLIITTILKRLNSIRCPIFTVDGKFLGLSMLRPVGSTGLFEILGIPVSKIKEFAGI